MTELNGIPADRVSAFAWALSSLFAGLAGVLIAPRFNTLAAGDFFNLVVVAVAAAAVGRLVSLPRALLGGLGLGILIAVLNTFLPAVERRLHLAAAAAGQPDAGHPLHRPLRRARVRAEHPPGPGGDRPARRRRPAAAGAGVADVPHPRRVLITRLVGTAVARSAIGDGRVHPRRRRCGCSSITQAVVMAIDLPVDHGDHRLRRADLAVPELRSPPSAPSPSSSSSTATTCRSSSPRWSARPWPSAVGGAAVAADPAPARHLGGHRHAGLRLLLRRRHGEVLVGRWRRHRAVPGHAGAPAGHRPVGLRQDDKAFLVLAVVVLVIVGVRGDPDPRGHRRPHAAGAAGQRGGGAVDRHLARSGPPHRLRHLRVHRRPRRRHAGDPPGERELRPRTSPRSPACSGSCSSSRSACAPSRARPTPPAAFSIFDTLDPEGHDPRLDPAQPRPDPRLLPGVAEVALRAVRPGDHPVRPPPRGADRGEQAAGRRRASRRAAPKRAAKPQPPPPAPAPPAPVEEPVAMSGHEQRPAGPRGHEAVRRHRRPRRRRHRRRRGRAGRPHRAQRRRQDDALQLPARRAARPTAARSSSPARTSRGLPVHAAGPARHRPHVPAHRAVRRVDRPRAPADRRAGPARRRPAVEGPARPRPSAAPTSSSGATPCSSCSGWPTSPTSPSSA